MVNLNQRISEQPNYRRYFETLFGDEFVNIEFWVLKHLDNGGSVLKLVYGLISPSKYTSGGNWRKSDFVRVYSSKGIAEQTELPKTAKLSITLPGRIAVSVVQEFCDGKTLEDAVKSSAVANIPPEFSKLKLAVGSEVEKEFVFRPPIIGVPENVIRTLNDYYKGLSSPIKDTVSIVAELFRLDKELLWKTLNGNYLPNTKGVLNGLVSKLTFETGLDFHGADIKRLGNLEWVVYPSKTKDENSLCNVSLEKYVANDRTGARLSDEEAKRTLAKTIVYKSIDVEILDGAFGAAELMVECAAYNGNDLVSNQALSSSFPAMKKFSFPLSEQVAGGDIKVFKKELPETTWSLWYYEHFDLFRSFSISSKFTHPEIPKSAWLDSLLAHGETGGSIHVPNHELKHLGDFNKSISSFFAFDPWNPIGERLVSLNSKLNPPVSRASLFPAKGKGVDVERVSDISEWLSECCKYHSANTCLIFDPYFGLLGVDVLLKTNISETELVVVTNCQCKSNDLDLNETLENKIQKQSFKLVRLIKKWALEKYPILKGLFSSERKNQVPLRATNIEKYCRDKQAGFAGRGIRIFDLRSKPVSSEQLFHDRYVLFFNKIGQLEAAYNLTNSIQGAMVYYPLLITPVPEDILGALQEYVVEFLMLNSKSNTREIVPLFSSHPSPKKDVRLLMKKWNESLVNPALIFSVLVPGSINANMDAAQIDSILRGLNVLVGDDSFDLQLPIADFGNVLDRISNMSPQNLLTFWRDFSEVMSRSRDSDAIMGLLVQSDRFQELVSRLLINNGFDDVGIQLDGFDFSLISDYLQKIKIGTEFGIALFNARQFSVYGARGLFFPGNYVVLQTINAAGRVNRLLLVEALDLIIEKSNWSNLDFFLFGKIIENLATQLMVRPDAILLNAFAGARSPFLKALISPALFKNCSAVELLNTFDSVSTRYSETEKVLLYSEWIYELRVRASRKGGNETPEDKSLKEACIARLIALFPVNNVTLLAEVMKKMDGPMWGSWALLNYQEIALGLVEAQKCSCEDLVSLWVGPLLKKIEDSTTDKQHFYYPHDSQITAVVGHILVSLDESKREVLLKRLKALRQKILGAMDRPRFKSNQPGEWSRLFQAYVWIHVLLIYLTKYPTFSGFGDHVELTRITHEGKALINGTPELREDGTNQLYAWYLEAAN